MNKKAVLELIKSGEGYTIELKEKLNSDIGKTFCAFANASGGKIIIGVKDNNEIIGAKLSNLDSSKIQDIARNMDPSSNVNVEVVDNLIVIHVPNGKNKPHTVQGHFYLRMGANSQQLKRDEIRTFFQKENQLFFDINTNNNFKFKSDFDNSKFLRFLEKSKISKDLPRTHVLKNLNLMTDDKITNAGVLFFCNKITPFFLNSSIVCVLYKGIERVDILDKKEFDEDFISNYYGVYNYVLSKLNTNFIIEGKERINKFELSEEALREAIINAMAHRNYFSQGHVQIDIFLDRVEISNPGNLLFDKKEFGKISLARNPIIMDLSYRLNLVEKVGSGINRMKKLCSDYGTVLDFEISSDWFRVIFYRTLQSEGLTGGLTGGLIGTLSGILNELLIVIQKNPNMQANQISKKLKRPIDTIEKQIKTLMDKKLIERKGSKKTGGYYAKQTKR